MDASEVTLIFWTVFFSSNIDPRSAENLSNFSPPATQLAFSSWSPTGLASQERGPKTPIERRTKPSENKVLKEEVIYISGGFGGGGEEEDSSFSTSRRVSSGLKTTSSKKKHRALSTPSCSDHSCSLQLAGKRLTERKERTPQDSKKEGEEHIEELYN